LKLQACLAGGRPGIGGLADPCHRRDISDRHPPTLEFSLRTHAVMVPESESDDDLYFGKIRNIMLTSQPGREKRNGVVQCSGVWL
jgi:hypothetical protein